MDSEQAQNARLKYKYRNMIMKGIIRLPYKGAEALVGPDCAYHLYSKINITDVDSNSYNEKAKNMT
ncbi:MAG: hypothetical protein L3V56_14810 [Candidatus Magnetoovum sp. WYHC-5]|nr:hypothetical protein [Candidatus Magnetoovum sp. WYHC-5]